MAPLSTPGPRTLDGAPRAGSPPTLAGLKQPMATVLPGYKEPPDPLCLQIRSCVGRNVFVCGHSPLGPQSSPRPLGCSWPLCVRPRGMCLLSLAAGAWVPEGGKPGGSFPSWGQRPQRGDGPWTLVLEGRIGTRGRATSESQTRLPVSPGDGGAWGALPAQPRVSPGPWSSWPCRVRPGLVLLTLCVKTGSPGVLLSGPVDLRGVPSATLTCVGPPSQTQWVGMAHGAVLVPPNVEDLSGAPGFPHLRRISSASPTGQAPCSCASVSYVSQWGPRPAALRHLLHHAPRRAWVSFLASSGSLSPAVPPPAHARPVSAAQALPQAGDPTAS